MDEAPPDLSSNKSDRVEEYKTMFTGRKVVHQRTISRVQPDGSSVYRTIMLVTRHTSTWVINNNNGHQNREGNEVPDAKSEPLNDRMVPSYGRGQATETHGTERIKDMMATHGDMVERFRLTHCLEFLVLRIIDGVKLLQPCQEQAKAIFAILDKVHVVAEHNLTMITPRKAQKRMKILLALSVVESVARHATFKDSAIEYENWSPSGVDGKPPRFKPEFLYDIIRSLHFTTEMVLLAWNISLDYNHSTSNYMFNSMTCLCEAFGLDMGSVMKKEPVYNPKWSIEGGRLTNPICVSDAKMTDDFFAGGGGVKVADLEKQATAMAWRRRTRALLSLKSQSKIDKPEDTSLSDFVKRAGIKIPGDAAAASSGVLDNVTSCVMPTINEMGIMHSIEHVASLLDGKSVEFDAFTNPEFAASLGASDISSGFLVSNKRSDPSYVISKEFPSLMALAEAISSTCTTATLFDIEPIQVRDCMLTSAHNKDFGVRVMLAPATTHGLDPTLAMKTPTGGYVFDLIQKMRNPDDVDKNSSKSTEMPKVVINTDLVSEGTAPARSKLSGVVDCGMQRKLDNFTDKNRFPVASVLFSNIRRDSPPVIIKSKWERQGVASQVRIQVSTHKLQEHAMRFGESARRVGAQPGMTNQQEKFSSSNGRAPCGFDGPERGGQPERGVAHRIPYPDDMCQMSLALEAFRRFSVGKEAAERHYEEYKEMYAGDVAGFVPDIDKIPHVVTKYQGLQPRSRRSNEESNCAYKPFISVSLPLDPHPEYCAMYPPLSTKADGEATETAKAQAAAVHGGGVDTDEVEDMGRMNQEPGSVSKIYGDLRLSHTMTIAMLDDMTSRGMIGDSNDTLIEVIKDSPFGLLRSLACAVSKVINDTIDAHPEMQEESLRIAGDEELEPSALSKAISERMHKKRFELYKRKDIFDENIRDLLFYGPVNSRNAKTYGTYHNMVHEPEEPEEAPPPAEAQLSAVPSYMDLVKRPLKRRRRES